MYCIKHTDIHEYILYMNQPAAVRARTYWPREYVNVARYTPLCIKYYNNIKKIKIAFFFSHLPLVIIYIKRSVSASPIYLIIASLKIILRPFIHAPERARATL